MDAPLLQIGGNLRNGLRQVAEGY